MNTALIIKKFGIGLTGGIATGKSTVAKILRSLHYQVIDADELSRKVTEPGSEGLLHIAEQFGTDIIKADGTLDRKALSAKVFAAPELRIKLEGITHPLIHKALIQKLKESGLMDHPKIWFYEAALLFEAGRAKEFREIWVTYCEHDTQIQRLQNRDNINRDKAERVIQAQMPALEKAKLGQVIIQTDRPIKDIEAQVRKALESLAER